MAWNHLPHQQQRGSQLGGGAPREAIAGRGAQKHDEADQQVAGAPARGIDYPAEALENRSDDITPTERDGDTQSWDDVVQPEAQARSSEHDEDGEPLPDGK
jgi:hypothetical protein